jgi:hypothetical protein
MLVIAAFRGPRQQCKTAETPRLAPAVPATRPFRLKQTRRATIPAGIKHL